MATKYKVKSFSVAYGRYASHCQDHNRIKEWIDENKSGNNNLGEYVLRNGNGKTIAIVKPSGHVKC